LLGVNHLSGEVHGQTAFKLKQVKRWEYLQPEFAEVCRTVSIAEAAFFRLRRRK